MDRPQLVRYSQENPNSEALKGKWGTVGENWGKVTVMKNVVCVIAYKGANVVEYKLPTVYDGFLICSDGTTVPVNDSTLTLSLAETVSAQGLLQLTKDN